MEVGVDIEFGEFHRCTVCILSEYPAFCPEREFTRRPADEDLQIADAVYRQNLVDIDIYTVQTDIPQICASSEKLVVNLDINYGAELYPLSCATFLTFHSLILFFGKNAECWRIISENYNQFVGL